MASLDKESVLARLRTVHEPGAGQDIVSRGQVSDVLIDGSKIYFSIAIDPAQAEKLEPMRKEAETAVLALPGVEQRLQHALDRLRADGGESPEDRRPRAGLAVGDDGPPDLAESLGEGVDDRVVEDLVHARGHVVENEAGLAGEGRRLCGGQGQAVLIVRTVGDDGAKAHGAERAEILVRQLRRDGELGCDVGNAGHGVSDRLPSSVSYARWPLVRPRRQLQM